MKLLKDLALTAKLCYKAMAPSYNICRPFSTGRIIKSRTSACLLTQNKNQHDEQNSSQQELTSEHSNWYKMSVNTCVLDCIKILVKSGLTYEQSIAIIEASIIITEHIIYEKNESFRKLFVELYAFKSELDSLKTNQGAISMDKKMNEKFNQLYQSMSDYFARFNLNIGKQAD